MTWGHGAGLSPVTPAPRTAQALAHLEAYIDFSEDDNVEEEVLSQGEGWQGWGWDSDTLSLLSVPPPPPRPPGSLPAVDATVRELEQEVGAHLQDGRRGELLRGGVHAVIAGPPNVGKSSLLNLLCEWGAGGLRTAWTRFPLPGDGSHRPRCQKGRGSLASSPEPCVVLFPPQASVRQPSCRRWRGRRGTWWRWR